MPRAQTAAAGAPAANPVDPAAVQALKDMGAQLQSLKRFRVSTELTGERVLADRQKLQHSASATIDVGPARTGCARRGAARARSACCTSTAPTPRGTRRR
jgi:hypothetical protein